MSLGPFAGITGSLKALRDIFPASTDTKINRLDATISSRLSETLGARQIELNAVKAKTDTIDQAALVTAIAGATRAGVEFSSTQNWTVPTGVTLIYITAQAGGGGGGGSGISGLTSTNTYNGSSGGSGGNAGAIVFRIAYSVSGGQVVGITVGGGGAGGLAAVPLATPSGRNGNDGTNGTDSSVTIASVEILRVQGGEGGPFGNRTQYQNPALLPTGINYFNALWSGGTVGGRNAEASIYSTYKGEKSTYAFGRNDDNGGAKSTNYGSYEERAGTAGGGGGHSVRANGGQGAQGSQSSTASGAVGTAGTLGSGGGGAGGAYRSFDSSHQGADGGAGGDGFVLIEF